MMRKVFVVSLLVLCLCAQGNLASEDVEISALEEGRTLVHNTMKRLAILVPMLTFKLGIMFTLLLVATVSSTQGLIVGSLLLALGVGHFIASKYQQGPSTTTTHVATLPAPHILGHHHHAAHLVHPHFLDRSGQGIYEDEAAAATGAHPQLYQAWRAKRN